MTRTQVVMLGSGTPNAEAGRVSAGLAIAVDDQPYLVDCGHSIVQRVVEARSAGKIAFSTADLNRLFLTHLHADHSVGLPDLIFSPWIHGRAKKLHVHGPAATQAMVSHLAAAYEVNVREHRRAHPTSEQGCQVTVHTLQPGFCYRDDLLSVHALEADHGDLEAYSFKFQTPDRCIVVSGDTKPTPEFADWARGCDVLIHEVYSAARLPTLPAAWQAYHSRVHTSSTELASLARQARPGILALYHQLFWGASPAELVAEVRSGYDGCVVSANDLDIY